MTGRAVRGRARAAGGRRGAARMRGRGGTRATGRAARMRGRGGTRATGRAARMTRRAGGSGLFGNGFRSDSGRRRSLLGRNINSGLFFRDRFLLLF